MKKFINVLAVMLALVMCLGIVVACASDDEQGSGDATTTTAANTTKPPVTTTKAPDTTTAEVTTTADPDAGRVKEPTVDVPADGMITTAAQLHAVLVKGDVTANYTVNADKLDMSAFAWTGIVGYTGIFDFGNCTIENAVDSLFVSVLGGTVKNLKLANATYYYGNDEAGEDINPKTNAAGNLYYSPVVRYATDITIQNVVIESTVKVQSEIWSKDSCHGGVIGGVEGSNIIIEDCQFKGEYTTDSTCVRVGGVVGMLNCSAATSLSIEAPEDSAARIVNCANYGTVTNLGFGEDSKSGAVVGYMSNAAAIKLANYGTMNSNDSGQTGGVVAYVGGSTYIKNCINVGDVTGASYTGGITGYSNGDNRYFENCINLGKITSGGVNVGGIVGVNKKTEKYTNCFNLTTATAEFGFNTVSNTQINPADPTTAGNTVITNCGNLDTVDAIFTAMDTANAGVFQKTAEGSIILAPAQ